MCAFLLTCMGYANATATEERFVESADAQLFCRTAGEGKALIVVHGGPGLAQDYLLPQFYQLAENNFVIFYDQRGCGRSTGEVNAETMTVHTFVEDLEAIRKAYNLDTVSILGHSWGAFLAMEYAIAHPECVDKLILANSWPSTSEGFALFAQESKRRLAPYQEEMDAISHTPAYEEGDPELFERVHRIMFSAYCYDPQSADLLDLRMSREAVLNCIKIHRMVFRNVFGKQYDINASLDTLAMPTLIIHGDSDPIPSSTAETLHEHIANSQYESLQHCGHFPHVEVPECFFETIHHFLN